MYLPRKELLEIRRAINAHPAANHWEGGKPIPDTDTKSILHQMESFFDVLSEDFPGGEWKNDGKVPPRAIEWWEKQKARDGSGRGFFHLHRDCLPGLVNMKPSELKVFLVCAGFANNGKDTNEAGMNPGEFFTGNENIALAARVNFSLVTGHLDALHDMGLVVRVRKHRWGTWVRKVSMSPGEEWDRLAAADRSKDDGRRTNKFPDRTPKTPEPLEPARVIAPPTLREDYKKIAAQPTLKVVPDPGKAVAQPTPEPEEEIIIRRAYKPKRQTI